MVTLLADQGANDPILKPNWLAMENIFGYSSENIIIRYMNSSDVELHIGCWWLSIIVNNISVLYKGEHAAKYE